MEVGTQATARAISRPIATAGDGNAQWELTRTKRLVLGPNGIKDCRENVLYLLRDHPEWQGVLGADTFSKKIVVRKSSPLGQAAGTEWAPRDLVQLGLWLQESVGLLVRSLDVLADGVAYVAGDHPFHPVREFLEMLAWDNVPRIETWAIQHLGCTDNEYTRLVSRFFLINLVRRIYEPGCVMRSVPVLEGPQDKGKSTALRMLAQPWFADTPFRVGDKDTYQQIQGVWLYEISELESFTRAEATAVKAFISSGEDNFRAPYERQSEKHKRQTVFGATTNAAEYLKDWTGNTRFWPLATGNEIDHQGLSAIREPLLAEALALYRQGAATYPSLAQQKQLFAPEQARRIMSHPWLDIVSEWMDGEGRYKAVVSIPYILTDVLRVDLAKISALGSEAHRVGQILHALGYLKHRASDTSRAHVWHRPLVDACTDGSSDELPF